MSGPYPCPDCGGSGCHEIEMGEDLVKLVPCPLCKGSGFRYLKTAGHGIPPLAPGEDPYEPAPLGGNY